MQIEGYRIQQWAGDLQWETFEVPEPGPGEVLVRVEACSIGLTVLNCIRGDLANDPNLLPRVPGHELVGRVETVGTGVASPAPGQRVMAYFYLACGVCHACRSGRDSLCQNLAGWVGIHRDGGYAPYTVLPAQNLLPLPETILAPQATAIPDAVATPLHVCKTRAQVGPHDRVVVIGAGGGVGIHMVQLARLFGAQVAGLEAAESKFDLIEEMGAAPVLSRAFDEVDLTGVWQSESPTVVIDLVGTSASLRWGLGTLTAGGRMVVLTTFRDVELPIEPRELVFREISLLGSRYASRAELMEAAALVATGQIRPVVSQVVPPSQVSEVHQALRQGTLVGRGALDWTGAYATTQ
jgi:D-arabinose 1-dehydrogenase-like Zn-dependent alcohol dehydrogenase